MNHHPPKQEYNPTLGKIRNIQGTNNIQYKHPNTLHTNTSRKKQFQMQKGQIQQYALLSYEHKQPPIVKETIIDISEILAPHSNVLKLNVTRNRHTNHKLRQAKERMSMPQRRIQQQIQSANKIPTRNNIQKSIHQIHQMSQQNVNILDMGLLQSKRYSLQSLNNKYMQQNLSRKIFPIQKQKVYLQTDDKNNPEIQRSNSLQPKNFQTKINSSGFVNEINELQQKILASNKDRSNNLTPNKKVKTINLISSPLKNNQQVVRSFSRINPTFLSSGSSYLSDNYNYLASFGKNILK